MAAAPLPGPVHGDCGDSTPRPRVGQRPQRDEHLLFRVEQPGGRVDWLAVVDCRTVGPFATKTELTAAIVERTGK